jgi:hypothetical protein
MIQKNKSNWEERKAKLRLIFPKLIDADLNFNEVRKSEILSKLEFKLGMTAQEIQVIIEKL